MKVVKNISGDGRLPSEFAQMNNFDNVYEIVNPTNKMFLAFMETYNGHYKDEDCEWIVEEK